MVMAAAAVVCVCGCWSLVVVVVVWLSLVTACRRLVVCALRVAMFVRVGRIVVAGCVVMVAVQAPRDFGCLVVGLLVAVGGFGGHCCCLLVGGGARGCPVYGPGAVGWLGYSSR